jgi:hypothetical protein
MFTVQVLMLENVRVATPLAMLTVKLVVGGITG